MSDRRPMVRLQDPPAPHYFVKPVTTAERRELRTGCARSGCGLPPAHPVHLRPSGDETPEWLIERRAANG